MRHLSLSVISLVLLAACGTGTASGQETDARVRSISVAGQGRVTGTPDMAVLNFSVRNRGKTAGEAFSGSSERMNAVISAFKEAGIEPRDLQTAQVNLNPVYAQNERGYQDRARIVAYEAVQTLTVRLRDIETAGEMIDLGVGSGANELQSFTLTIDETEALEDEARVAAVRDARRKAEMMAEAAGASLGQVMTISAYQGGGRPVPMMASARMASADVAEEMSIEAGEQELTVNVQVTFALK